MGNCNNLGENSVYILKKRNMECPNNLEQICCGKNFEYEDKFTGSWFSGNTNLGESGKTVKNQQFALLSWALKRNRPKFYARSNYFK